MQVKWPRRGEIYLVNFDPTVGSEIRKTRPALIIQNDLANRHGQVTIVAAITSQIGEKLYPTEVHVSAAESGLTKNSVVLLNQIRTVDKARLIRKLGKVGSSTMSEVNRRIEISLGLIDL